MTPYNFRFSGVGSATTPVILVTSTGRTGTSTKGPVMSVNSFGSRDSLAVGGVDYEVYRLDQVSTAVPLPYSLRVLLENLLRNEDGRVVTAEQVEALREWTPQSPPEREIQYTPELQATTAPELHAARRPASALS